jgi:hypothetical protein
VRLKLTFANVVSCLAVFVALGSGAYAATQLPKNSVAAKQIKKNAITTAKIKNEAVTEAKIKNEAVTAAKVKKGTLTGAQINSSTLGTVPNAGNADSLAGVAAVGYQQRIRWAYVSAAGTVLASGGGPAPTVIPEPPGVYYIEWGSPVTGDAVISTLAEANVFSAGIATSPCGGPPLGVSSCFKGSESSSETLTYTLSSPGTEKDRAFYIALVP